MGGNRTEEEGKLAERAFQLWNVEGKVVIDKGDVQSKWEQALRTDKVGEQKRGTCNNPGLQAQVTDEESHASVWQKG